MMQAKRILLEALAPLQYYSQNADFVFLSRMDCEEIRAAVLHRVSPFSGAL